MDIHFVYMWQFATIVLLTRTGYGAIPDNLSKVNETCVHIQNSRHCLYLYGQSRLQATWTQAKDFCAGHHQQLATLQHTQLVDMMGDFTGIIKYSESVVHAWVAGRRKTTEIWYNVFDGKVYNTGDWPNFGTGVCPGQQDGSDTCGILDTTLPAKIYRCKCAPNPQLYAVCAYITNEANCTDVYFGEVCYFVSPLLTWYEASTYCSQTYPGGYLDLDVAHASNRNTLITLFLKAELPAHIWVGLVRRPWQWINGDDTTSIIRIFNWSPHEGNDIDPSTETTFCLHIEPNLDGSWADKKCTVGSNYFICQSVDPVSTSATTTPTPKTTTSKPKTTTSQQKTTTTHKPTTTTMTKTNLKTSNTISTPGTQTPATVDTQSMPSFVTTATHLSQDPHFGPQPTEDYGSDGFNIVYVIPIILGVLIIIAVILVPVICIRRRKENKAKQSKPEPYTYVNNPMVIYDDDPEAPYMITPGPYDPTAPRLSNGYDLAGRDDPPLNNPSNNETDPADLYSKPNKSGTGAHGNSIKGVMSHKTAKSGDIYSLPSKSTDGQDSGEGPSEPYSLPQKSDRQEEEDDLEDVIMDNPTYGSMQ